MKTTRMIALLIRLIPQNLLEENYYPAACPAQTAGYMKKGD